MLKVPEVVGIMGKMLLPNPSRKLEMLHSTPASMESRYKMMKTSILVSVRTQSSEVKKPTTKFHDNKRMSNGGMIDGEVGDE